MRLDVYELVALGMRYWFVMLGVVILLRAVKWALRDHRAYRRTLMDLPDAGLIGEIVNIETGAAHPLPREGVIGSSRTCDVRLHGLRAREVEFVLKEGTGVHVTPCHMRHSAVLDGHPLDRRDSWAAHGSRLSLPGYYLRFRLFAGLDVPSISYQDEQAAYDTGGAGETAFDMESLAAIDGLEGIPLEPVVPQDSTHGPFQQDLSMTWTYAVPPDMQTMQSAAWQTADAPEEQEGRVGFFRRKRRSSRREP